MSPANSSFSVHQQVWLVWFWLIINKFGQKPIHQVMKKLLEDPEVQKMLLEEKHIHIPN